MKGKTISDSDLKDILVNPKLTRREQYICDCPFCGKESHFYISRKTQLWDCKKCGEYGNIYKLLKFLDKTYLLQGSTIEIRDNLLSLRNIQKDVNDDEVTLKNLPVISMPAGWKISCNSTKYLLARGISSSDCKRYNIGTTDLFRKFKNYVLIPVYDNNEIRGFVGRYASKKVPLDKLRYNNSIGTEFSELLFGYDEITNKTRTVILVEGIFDKIATDKFLELWKSKEIKCVCTFGKKISKEQTKKLLIKGVSRVILLYDFDAIKDIKRYGLELKNNFITSITYTSSKKDIDECTKEEAMEVFQHLQSPESFNVDVIGKLKR